MDLNSLRIWAQIHDEFELGRAPRGGLGVDFVNLSFPGMDFNYFESPGIQIHFEFYLEKFV